MQEIEIKLRVKSPAAMRRQLGRLGFERAGPRLFERNFVLDKPEGTLWQSGHLLRLRLEGRRWRLTWKGPTEVKRRHKIRQEIEVETAQGEQLGEILGRLGYRPAFEYQKYRTEFHRQNDRGKVLLDETPIGNFLELEGPPRWIDRIASQLGFGSADFIVDSYASLYFAWRREQGLPPADMVFPRKKSLRPFQP